MKKPVFITAERRRKAQIFKTYIEKALGELGPARIFFRNEAAKQE